MAVRYTPGLAFIVSGLPAFLVTIFVAIALQQYCARFNFALPTWFLVTVAILGPPLTAAARIVVGLISERREADAKGARLVPLVRGKWIGNADVLRDMMAILRTGYPGDGLNELCEEHGPVMNLRVFWDNLIFTIDPNHVKLLLATDFNNFVKGERFRNGMHSVLGTGVFNSDGEMWKFHRSMTKKFFTKDRISHFDIFDRHADEAIKQMKIRLREGHAIDFQDVMSRFTLDSATEFLFGSCVHSLSSGLSYPHNVVSKESQFRDRNSTDDFPQAFLEAQTIISDRERLGFIWPLFEIFKDKTDEPMKVVNAHLEPIIKDAIEKNRKALPVGEADLDDDETVLDHLVKFTSDPVILKDEMLNIMIAGRDTTAATLTFVVYFLSIYPEIRSRLREEILTKVGPIRRPTYDDIRELKYLRAVINETMRLYPAVPFNVRESIHATTWPSPDPNAKPIYIPTGTKVAYSVLMMQRRPELWGPDASEFDPDRFLDERLQKYVLANPFIFLPFNGGPRICLGQQFAYNEMSFMLIRLLQNFSGISLDSDAQPPECRPPAHWATAQGRKAIERIRPKCHLTIYTAGGLWVRLEEAEAAKAGNIA